MTRLLCGPLAAWTSAWLAGGAAFDDVLSAVEINAPAPALALAAPSGAPRPADARPEVGQAAQLGEVLIAWRRANAHVRLVLPVPGDTRGILAPPAFRSAALDAGQAVVGVGPDAAIGVVPTLIDRRPSSAPAILVWRRFDIDPPVADPVDVADAQYELTEAIREGASALARLDLAALAGAPDLGDELSAARRAGERINLPPGFPARAVSLIAQAERMSAVLRLAGVDRPTASGPDDRTHVLAPLVTAVRRARLAGYNAVS